MNKTVFLTGATGLLGRAIRAEFSADEAWNCVSVGFSRSSGDIKKLDLKDEKDVAAMLKDTKVSPNDLSPRRVGIDVTHAIFTLQPDIVIHSAAERRPDNVEKQEVATKELNVDATRHICKHASQHAFYFWNTEISIHVAI